MPQHTHAQGHICAHCDGFPRVAVAICPRRPNGTLPTITVDCPACHGTGTTTRRRTLTTAGR